MRLAFGITLLLGALFSPIAAEAEQAAKVARYFLQGLRDLGYVEGRNLVIEWRDAEGKPERLPALAAELVALKVDVIVTTGGTLGALAAKQAGPFPSSSLLPCPTVPGRRDSRQQTSRRGRWGCGCKSLKREARRTSTGPSRT